MTVFKARNRQISILCQCRSPHTGLVGNRGAVSQGKKPHRYDGKVAHVGSGVDSADQVGGMRVQESEQRWILALRI